MPGNKATAYTAAAIVLLLSSCSTPTPGNPKPATTHTAAPRNTSTHPTPPRNPAAVTFRPVLTQTATTTQSCPTTRTQPDPKQQLTACDLKSTTKYTLDPAVLDGTDVSNATFNIDDSGGGWQVNLTFTSQGTKTWANYTTHNISKQVAIVVDNQVVSAPTIEAAITDGNTEISGNFTRDDAEQLADRITGR